ncbi:MAG: GNAT family N-acetyltransferase [Micrococcaceae bacterium]|nr:GNAT family N-acetyltransferase [Micrococcaceae bacterium]
MLELKKVHSNKLRSEAEDFFAAHIEDPSRFRILPGDFEKEKLGGISDVVLARAADAIVGAAHYSAPYYELVKLAIEPENKVEVLNAFVMLYNIAVAKEHRGSGLGAKLLAHVEEQAVASGHQVVYGVCEPAAKGFYEKYDYNVGAPNEALALQCGTQQTLFRIEGQSLWFWKDLAGANGRRLVLNSPRKEPDQTSKPAEHTAAHEPYEPSGTIHRRELGTETNPGIWKRFWNWLTAQ